MSELRPCPFCGNEPVVEGNLVACNNLNCPTHDNYWTDPMIFTCDQWNTRPIEDELHARIARLEAERRWIPVSERLPKEKQSVLALDRTGTAYHWEYSKCLSNIFVGYYTHWMPLPKLPEVQE